MKCGFCREPAVRFFLSYDSSASEDNQWIVFLYCYKHVTSLLKASPQVQKEEITEEEAYVYMTMES